MKRFCITLIVFIELAIMFACYNAGALAQQVRDWKAFDEIIQVRFGYANYMENQYETEP